MIWEDAEQALIEHFKLTWEASDFYEVKVNYPNTPALNINTKTEPYLRLRIIVIEANRVVVGGGLRISRGEVAINTFVPLGTGTELISNLNRTITEIWDTAKENGLDGGIHLGAPEPITGAKDPNVPTLWRSGVVVSFTIDHTPSAA